MPTRAAQTLLEPPSADSYAVHGECRVSDLLINPPTFSPSITCAEAVSFFLAHPEYDALPVVKDERPLGLLVRHALLGRFVRPFQHELYGNKSCTLFMDAAALTVDKTCSVAD